MTDLKITKQHVGRKVRLRNGNIETILSYDEKSDTPVKLSNYFYYTDGGCVFIEKSISGFNIKELLPLNYPLPDNPMEIPEYADLWSEPRDEDDLAMRGGMERCWEIVTKYIRERG